jgi:hypothetical protein
MSFESILENFVVGIVIFFIEVLIIAKIVKSFTTKREKKLWAPFRSLFYRSIYEFNESLLLIYQSWSENLRTQLRLIHNAKKLSTVSLKKLDIAYDFTLDEIKSKQLVFFNLIQTVSPSLTPDTGPHTTEVMYFYERFSQYVSRGKKKIKSANPDYIIESDYSETLLKDLWSGLIAMQILVSERFGSYSERLKDIVREKEKLYFYRGEFLNHEDYNYMTQGDQSIINYKQTSSKIPRMIPTKKFFDDDFKI